MNSRPASLPMYDADRAAVQRWWHGLAAAMRGEGLLGVPDGVEWPADLHGHWQLSRLLLSQACGHPLRTSLWGRVQVVGAFRYAVPGCAGIDYRSELMARHGDGAGGIADFRNRTAALNDRRSQSGWQALRDLVAPLASPAAPLQEADPFFAACIETGSHRASLAAVQEGRADIAAVDCVTLAGLRRHHPRLLDGLASVGHTAPSPGLPLITAATTAAEDLGRLRRALHAACASPTLAGAREALFIAGFTAAPAAAWWPSDAQPATALPLMANTTPARPEAAQNTVA